jgi:hypothetical protein
VGRRLAIAALVLASLVAAGASRAQARELWPGVTFHQTIQPTPHGPVVIDVLTGPRPGGATTLEPLLSNDALTGRETLTSLERRLSGDATYAGVNGDFFNLRSGLPSGGLIQGGQLVSLPSTGRSTAGITDAGALEVRRAIATGAWTGSDGATHPFVLNRPPESGETSLFTSSWGPSTPAVGGATAVVLFPFLGGAPGVDSVAAVQSVVAGASAVAVPPGGAVLLARGAAAARLKAAAPAGATVTTRLDLQPAWPGLVAAIGGGPQIVRNEQFTTAQLSARAPRTAVGQLKDGRVVLVAVDGRQGGWSVGMTNFELAQALVRLGAVTAMALDGGGSTVMAADGVLLNRPSDGVERPISTALTFAYTGVYVEQQLATVSPNGDGVDDVQSLSYKLVRPSTVTAALVAPGGPAPTGEPVEQPPGTYTVAFPPAGDASPVEGTWKLTVAATDQQGQRTSMTRSFTVDDTLGFLQASPRRLFLPPGGRRIEFSWKQTRPARVVVTVETKTGSVVRSLAARRVGAGDATVGWDGLDRSGKRVKGGVYEVHVVAKSEIGTTELDRAFAVQQTAG